MDAIEATLGTALLIAAGLAVVLVAIILLLIEATIILRLARKLALAMKSLSSQQGGCGSSSADRPPTGSITQAERD